MSIKNSRKWTANRVPPRAIKPQIPQCCGPNPGASSAQINA
jgi:hypothetical protein